jgi:hypothetical protein
MPAPRGSQNGALSYAVIIFAALFVAATVVAVVFYLKAEDYRTTRNNLQSQLDELASRKEIAELGKTVGEIVRGKTRIGALLDYLEQQNQLMLGDRLPDLSAQLKFETAANAYKELVARLSNELAGSDPTAGQAGLVRLAEVLAQNLQTTRQTASNLEQQLADFAEEYGQQIQATLDKQKTLVEQNKMFAEQARQTDQNFEQRTKQIQENAGEQINVLRGRFDQATTNSDKQHQQLLQERAKYMEMKESRDRYKGQVETIAGRPDTELQAYKPDGRIISVDKEAGIVLINRGINDRVYRGLTFAVYDKNIPIPRDGKAKAEIEVLDVQQNVSVARISRADKKNPIIPDDIIANLIWDRDATNLFMVSGDFDFNDDGQVDSDGPLRICELIERWGGKVQETITIQTDFVVLGLPPRLPPKPTHEQLEVDPAATEKYQAAMDKLESYKRIREQAESLSLPIFNLDRFLHFIGYHALASSKPVF